MVVLIGPPGAGKSTVASLLAEDFVDIDEVAGPLYREAGWSVDLLGRRISEVGFEAAHAEWEPALAHAVERLVEIHPARVVALGAGHIHCTRPDLFERIRTALAPVPVVLLRPSADPAVSLPILRERCLASKGHPWQRDGIDWLDRWLGDGCDERLATWTVHGGDEPAEITAHRVRGLLCGADAFGPAG